VSRAAVEPTAGVCNVDETALQGSRGGGEIELTPANPDSARIYIHPMADWIYVLVGRDTSEELFIKWRKEAETLEQLRKILRSVIEGKFREDIWMLDGKPVRSRGRIEIDGKAAAIGGFWTFSNPLRRKQRSHFDYAPYVYSGGSETGTDAP